MLSLEYGLSAYCRPAFPAQNRNESGSFDLASTGGTKRKPCMELPELSWRVGFMSYIDETLADNERLIYRARFHWLHKIGAWITLGVFLVLAAASLTWGQGSWSWLAAGIVAGDDAADLDHGDRRYEPAANTETRLAASKNG